MIAALLLDASVPLLHQLFTPLSLTEQLQHTPNLILAVLLCCLATAYLALWRAAPDFRIFRNMGIFIALVAVDNFSPYFGFHGSTWTVRAITVVVLVEIAAEAMRIRNRLWTRYFWPIYGFAAIAGWFPSMAFVQEWPIVFSEVALFILVVQGFRQGKSTDRLIAWVFLGYFLVRMPLSTSFQHLTGIGGVVNLGSWAWPYPVLVVILLGSVILAVFVRDLIRDRGDKMQLAAEIAAARSVQQYLIPDQLPMTPGLAITSEYRPAREVGGDFFQVLPDPADGSVLIVVGDVAGHGMKAGMLATLIIGAIRTAAVFTTDPARIVALLNARMHTRGLATCLALRIEKDGKATLANAGHLPPYLNGQELPVEGALPLGAIPSVDFPVMRFQFAEGDTLMLMSDGVAEAQTADGRLFGFERIGAMLCEHATAAALAAAAQAHGQEDDITVLTVARF
jgi:hypothetical protein